MSVKLTRNQRLALHLTPKEKHTLRVAATTKNQTLGEFVVESALAHAEEILPDRQRFGLGAKQWAAFQASLNAPPRPMPRLARLLRESSIIEFDREN